MLDSIPSVINIDNNNFIILSLKNIKYYKSLYNLIFLYKNELNNFIKNDIIKEHLESNINENIIKNIIKKIEKYISDINYEDYEYKMTDNKKEKEILKLLKLFKKLINLNNILKENIDLISNIDIFDQKTLMSDTTKNNINKNKLHIIDIYNLYQNKIISDNKTILNDIVDKIITLIIPNTKILNATKLNLSYTLIKTIINYFNKNILIIDLFCLFMKNIKNIDESIDDLIFVSIENFKNSTIEKELLNEKINSNMYLDLNLKGTKTSKKNNFLTIKEHMNIVKNLNKFIYLNSYESLNNLFSKYLDSVHNKITNNFIISTLLPYHLQNLLLTEQEAKLQLLLF